MSVIDFSQKRLEVALKKCNAQAGGATEINYKEAKIMAPTLHIEQVLQALSESEDKRLRIMRSVNEYLRKYFDKTLAGKSTQKVAMNVSQNIAIWYANKLLLEAQQREEGGK